jgi:molybdopterin synthase catalytic subunit
VFRLSDRPIVPESPADPSAGACVTFEGRVRNEDGGRPVSALEYEAYPGMAEREGAKVVEEAVHAFGVREVRCIHRVGRLGVGELAVWIAVTAGHRDEAFRACRFVIDEIKRRVPIWKKEVYADGADRWVGS